jgi:hypothetical protein
MIRIGLRLLSPFFVPSRTASPRKSRSVAASYNNHGLRLFARLLREEFSGPQSKVFQLKSWKRKMSVSKIAVVDRIAVENNGEGGLNDRGREEEFYVVFYKSM